MPLTWLLQALDPVGLDQGSRQVALHDIFKRVASGVRSVYLQIDDQPVAGMDVCPFAPLARASGDALHPAQCLLDALEGITFPWCTSLVVARYEPFPR